MNIPVEDIAVVNRGRKDLGDIPGLAESIKANGQITAGVVRRSTPEDKELYDIDAAVTPYVLVAGERRYRAVVLAGKDTYLCEDFGELGPKQQRILELEENLHRKDLTWDEEASMRNDIHEMLVAQAAEDDREWSQKDTARYLGESVATISRDLQVAKAIEADPTLKAAGSKKAASRILEMREHMVRNEAQQAAAKSTTWKLRDLLVQGDSRDHVRTLADGSVSLTLTDFPYGLGMDTLRKVKAGAAEATSAYDDSEGVTLDLYIDMVPQLLRVTKPSGWICTTMSETAYAILKDLFESCCTTHYEYAEVIWEQQESGDWIKKILSKCSHVHDPREGECQPCTFVKAEVPGWLWYRPNSQNPTRMPERHAKNFYEPILVINRGEGRLYKHQDDCPNVLVHDADYGNERLHVMQKPRSLARDLVQRFALPGDLVYDPFFGSGSLLAGAAELHCKIIGCEKNPLQVDLALGNVANFYGG